ncbi:hypothetical protein FACS189425_03680 [Clostridia bacterium]|nr:hypothetical protein FACS189425_03680 [Clostridia bacterium]
MKKVSFEENLKRLDEIVGKLERGDAALDDSLKLFDEGTALVAKCNKLLDGAEQKVRLILKNADGEPAEEIFEGEEL